MRLHRGGLGYAPTISSISVSSVWVGGVSTSGATVKARSTDASSAVLRYSPDSSLAGYQSVAGTEGDDDVWTFQLTGLSANTTYYYGFTGSAVTGRFHTFPTSGSFALWAASCAGHSGGEYVTDDVSNAPTFDVIRDKLLDGTLIGGFHLGDRHYRDISTDSDALFQDAYHDVMAADKQLGMHKAGWMDYVWDDHDFGPNDSYSGSASKPAAQTVYRQHVPYWPLEVSDSIQHTYVIGRVRFIVLDERSYRSQNTDTDNSSKTMLGATQKAWFIDLVDTSTEPLIVVVGGTPWHGDGNWTWGGGFTTEQNELLTAFGANTSKMIWVYGDNHFLAGDDGTNAPGGIPSFNLAPLDGGFTNDTATYTTGQFKNEQQQYGTLAFADDGSDITVTVKGWSVNSSSVETERFSVALGPYS